MLVRTASNEGGNAVTSLTLPRHAEHVITACGTDAADLHRRISAAAASRKASLLGRFVFAGNRHAPALQPEFTAADGCVAWLQGDTSTDGGVSSMQAVALSGLPLQPVRDGGRLIGFVYEDEHARYCRLGGVLPRNLRAGRGAQVREVFEILDSALEANGFRFTDTVRTWFYLDKLLDWYGEFNQVRTAFFLERRVFDQLVPASTGIGAGNPAGAALSCDLLAVQPKTAAVRIAAVPSPMQCPALSYRSSFSRAVEVAFPSHRSLIISGTASIAPDGTSAHRDNPAAQIRLTLDVVEAILGSRDMNWGNLSRGIAYFADLKDAPLFAQACRDRNIPHALFAPAHAAVCRHDLLFEIEADAVA